MQATLKNKLGFASYDFSNSGYVAVFQAFLFPLVLTAALDQADYNSALLWPMAVAASSILAIISGPFIGRLADIVGRPKIFSLLVIVVGVLATISVPLLDTTPILLCFAFICFNWAFEQSQSIYDSFLVSDGRSSRDTTAISSFAWGVGYLGGALFAASYFLFTKLEIAETTMLSIFGVMFLIASIPALVFFRNHTPVTDQVLPELTKRTISIREIKDVKNPVPWVDLFVYWVIADTVAAILYFAPLYLKTELSLSTTMIGGVLLVGQIIAFPATILVGRLSTSIGRIKAIQIGLVVWAVGLAGLYLASTVVHVALVFCLLSLVVGSTQALMRAHFADRISLSSAAEGFGFFAIAQKSSSVFAPLLIATVVAVSGSVAPAFAFLAALICVALLASKSLREVYDLHLAPKGGNR